MAKNTKNKRKEIAYATACDTVMIFCSSMINHPLNCPKTWRKGPKCLKILKIKLFS